MYRNVVEEKIKNEQEDKCLNTDVWDEEKTGKNIVKTPKNSNLDEANLNVKKTIISKTNLEIESSTNYLH